MSQQLLDRPQIRSTLEKMGRERVSEGVRVHGALGCSMARPRPQPAPDVRRGQPAAGLREEQRTVRAGGPGAAGEPRPAALEPARDGLQRLLADRHEARLAALALDADLLILEV